MENSYSFKYCAVQTKSSGTFYPYLKNGYFPSLVLSSSGRLFHIFGPLYCPVSKKQAESWTRENVAQAKHGTKHHMILKVSKMLGTWVWLIFRLTALLLVWWTSWFFSLAFISLCIFSLHGDGWRGSPRSTVSHCHIISYHIIPASLDLELIVLIKISVQVGKEIIKIYLQKDDGQPVRDEKTQTRRQYHASRH